MNIRAAKKNAGIAKVSTFVDFSKHNLDELDVRYSEGSVDNLVFYLTKKDEDKLNEVYHQAKYVLKPKGKLLIIAREKWELSVSSKFSLLEEETVSRGDSRLKYWLLEKI